MRNRWGCRRRGSAGRFCSGWLSWSPSPTAGMPCSITVCAPAVVDCDGSDAAAVEQAIAASVECFGRLDIVVADAGINGVWTLIEEPRPDEWINPLYSAVLPHRLMVL